MLLTGLVGAGLVVWKYSPGRASPVFVGYWLTLTVLSLPPRSLGQLSALTLFTIALFQTTLLWAYCSIHSDSRLGGDFFWPLFTAFIGFVPAVAIALPWPRISLLVTVLYCLLAVSWILPQQIEWGGTIKIVHEEADSIITYANDFKSQNGYYPYDLTGYEFHRPELSDRFYYSGSNDRFGFECWITDSATTYGYGSDTGWSYDAD